MSHFTPNIPSRVSDKVGESTQQKTVADYEAEIKATTYSGDFEKVIKAMEKDPGMGAAAKAKLRAIGDAHRVNFTN